MYVNSHEPPRRPGIQKTERFTTTSINEAPYGGAGFGSTGARSDGVCEQSIRLLQAAGSRKDVGRSLPKRRSRVPGV